MTPICRICEQNVKPREFFRISKFSGNLYGESDVGVICSKCFDEASDNNLQDSFMSNLEIDKQVCPYCHLTVLLVEDHYSIFGFDQENIFRKSGRIDPYCYDAHIGIKPIPTIQSVNITITPQILQQSIQSVFQASGVPQSLIVSPSVLKQIDKVFEKANIKK